MQSYLRGGSQEERFALKTGAKEANGCIPWLAGTKSNGKQRYPSFAAPEHKDDARRVAWALAGNTLDPKREMLRRTCANEMCVNHEHLEKSLRPAFRPKTTRHFLERRVENFWTRVDRSGGPSSCWLWKGCLFTQAKNKKHLGQYGRLGIKDEGKLRFVKAHRFAWVLTNGAIPKGMLVCHKCDNPPCCNPAHLFLGTHRDNVMDAISKGRFTQHTRFRKR